MNRYLAALLAAAALATPAEAAQQGYGGTLANLALQISQNATAAQSAGNLTSGTLPLARLDSTVLLSTGNLGGLNNLATARTNLGLGGMAVQNGTSVTITGGSISNTVVGSGTPAQGTFTLLSSANVALTGGNINNTTIGAGTPSSGRFSTLASASVALTGGAIDGTSIGGTTPGAGAFTTLSASGAVGFTGAVAAAAGITVGGGAGAAFVSLLNGLSAFNGTGLTAGWNYTGSQGEADILLGPQGGAGGLNIYQLTSAGALKYSTPLLGMDGTGNLALASQDTGTAASALTISATANAVNGASLKLIGDGGASPSKTLRVHLGTFSILNDAGTTQLFTLSNNGAASFTGLLSGTGLTLSGSLNATGSLNGGAINLTSTTGGYRGITVTTSGSNRLILGTNQGVSEVTPVITTYAGTNNGGQPVASVASAAGITPGMYIFSGVGGIPPYTYVVSVSGNNVTMSQNFGNSVTAGNQIVFNSNTGSDYQVTTYDDRAFTLNGGSPVFGIQRGSGLVYAARGMTITPTTIGLLPPCNSANEGTSAAVNNAASPSYGAALTAGGTAHVSAYCNGTSWVAS